MHRGRPRRMLSLVSNSTVHIAIEAHVDDDEIRGQISSDAGPPGSFSGWLALISALDGLLSPGLEADRAGGAPERRGGPRCGGEQHATDVEDEYRGGEFDAQQ
jgi:hypothetical protein